MHLLFKTIKTLNTISYYPFVFLSILSISAILGGCGKRKPPVPPIEKVSQKAAVSGFQRGNKIFLSWSVSPQNKTASSLENISRVDVYRLTEETSQSNSLSEDEFAAKSTLIASLPVSDTNVTPQMQYIDALNFTNQSVRLRYALKFVNKSGQKAGFSNFLVLEPANKIAIPPAGLKYQSTESFIKLEWNPPAENIDGSKPANVLGFNIYRSINGSLPKLVNKTPVSGNEFSDESFVFERNYQYFLRTVSVGKDGDPVESEDSQTLSIYPKDVYAPAAPTAVTIAAAPGTVSIFFANNLEKDVAGYRIFRSQNPDLPESQWESVTPDLIQKNTFQDTNVVSGKRYFYFIVAYDTAGNKSSASKIVSETVP